MRTSDDLVFSLTEKITLYEEGDVLLQSEWIDLLEEWNGAFATESQAARLVAFLVELIGKNLVSGPIPDYVKTLSSGIDLAQSALAAPGPDSDSQIRDWIASFDEEAKKETLSPELLSSFVADGQVRLARGQELILELEAGSAESDSLNELFRVFHTLKGECGFLKLPVFGDLTHNVENVLALLRDGTVKVQPGLVDLLLEGVDLSRRILESLLQGRGEDLGAEELSAYKTKLELSLAGGDQTSNPAAPPSEKKTPLRSKVHLKSENQDQIVRIRASKVDNLVDTIGELIVSLGQIPETSQLYTQIKKTTKSLHQSALQLKTEKITNLFGSVKRTVRDLARKLDKKVVLETSGDDLEIDRELIEKLEEPLLHIVRNSLDHGLETESVRRQKGKNPMGLVRVAAQRRGNLVELAVSDDGKGLDREKILAKAVERGLVKPEAAASMEDNDVFSLIFLNGFSTAETVSLVSGRGVGMDIVQTVVNSARGRIKVVSTKDQGTTIHLLFPLTTALIDGLLVRLDSRYFVLPVSSVIETIKVGSDLKSGQSSEVIKLRDEMLQVIPLGWALNGFVPDSQPKIGVIVENLEKKKFILLVDEVLVKKEFVIKALGRSFKEVRGISAGTIITGGELALVVDVDETIRFCSERELVG